MMGVPVAEADAVVARDTLAPSVSRRRLDVTWNGDRRTTDEAAVGPA